MLETCDPADASFSYVGFKPKEVLWGPFCALCMHEWYSRDQFSNKMVCYMHLAGRADPYKINELICDNGSLSPFLPLNLSEAIPLLDCSRTGCPNELRANRLVKESNKVTPSPSNDPIILPVVIKEDSSVQTDDVILPYYSSVVAGQSITECISRATSPCPPDMDSVMEDLDSDNTATRSSSSAVSCCYSSFGASDLPQSEEIVLDADSVHDEQHLDQVQSPEHLPDSYSKTIPSVHHDEELERKLSQTESEVASQASGTPWQWAPWPPEGLEPRDIDPILGGKGTRHSFAEEAEDKEELPSLGEEALSIDELDVPLQSSPIGRRGRDLVNKDEPILSTSIDINDRNHSPSFVSCSSSTKSSKHGKRAKCVIS